MKKNIFSKLLILSILTFIIYSCADDPSSDTSRTNVSEEQESKACDGKSCKEDHSCCMPEEMKSNSEVDIDCTEAQKAQAQKYLDNNWAPPSNSEDDTQFCKEWYDHLVKLSMSGTQDEEEGTADN